MVNRTRCFRNHQKGQSVNLMRRMYGCCVNHFKQKITNFSTGKICGKCRKKKKNLRVNEDMREKYELPIIGQLFCGKCITDENKLKNEMEEELKAMEEEPYLKKMEDAGDSKREKEHGKQEVVYMRLYREKSNLNGAVRNSRQKRSIMRRQNFVLDYAQHTASASQKVDQMNYNLRNLRKETGMSGVGAPEILNAREVLAMSQKLKFDGNQRTVKAFTNFCKNSGVFQGSQSDVINLQKRNDDQVDFSYRKPHKKGEKFVLAAQTKSVLTTLNKKFQYDVEKSHLYFHPGHINQPVTFLLY